MYNSYLLPKIIDGYQRAIMFIVQYDLEKKLGGKGASKKMAELIKEKSLK